MSADIPHASQTLVGVVLAGGRSVRFGGEKAAALLRGTPLLLWAARRLARSCAAVAVNTRPGTQAESLAHAAGLPVLHDAPGDAAGPLSGVKAGLVWARELGATAAGGQSLRCAVAAGRPLYAAEHRRGLGRGHGRDRRRRAAAVRGLAGQRARGRGRARWQVARIRRPGACSMASVRSASASPMPRRSPTSILVRISPPSRTGSGGAPDGTATSDTAVR